MEGSYHSVQYSAGQIDVIHYYL